MKKIKAPKNSKLVERAVVGQHALFRTLSGVVDKIADRAIWLSNTLCDLSSRVDVLRDETGAKINDLWKDSAHLRLAVAEAFKNLEERTKIGFERVEVDVKALRADVDRAWSLQESRNAVHRKAADDLFVALQRFNERLSKLEGNVVIANGQVGMLGECIAAHNNRIENLEYAQDEPSLVDQQIVDSKFLGAHSLIASLEKRLRALESQREEKKAYRGEAGQVCNEQNAANKKAFDSCCTIPGTRKGLY